MVTATTGTLPQLRGTSSEERTLVLAAAARHADAFGTLYQRYAGVVYNLILRSVRNKETAEDIAQEVWTKVYHDLPKLRDPLAFPAWLYRMTSRICVDDARKRTRAPQTAEISGDVPAERDDPEAAALGGHDVQLTREALAMLPAHQHLALFLREVDGRSYREISQIIGISETAVGLCLLRARRTFAKTYERLDRASQRERCSQIQPNLARVFDGEATPVQRTAVDGHLAACGPCREDLRLMREGSRRYAALALAPVPAALHAKIFAALGLGAGGLGGAAGLLGSLAAKVKMMLFGLLAAGGVAAGVAVVPGAAPAVVHRVFHQGDAPVVSQLAPDTPSGATVPPPPSTGGAAESNGRPAPRKTDVTPAAAIGAAPLPVAVSTSSLSLVPIVPAVPIARVAPVVSDVASVVPTIAALPSTLVPAAPLPALPLALPTVTVEGLTLP